MRKTSTDLTRRTLSGPTMGKRWSVVFFAVADRDLAPLQTCLQAAVDEVDAQMSTWTPTSDLMRFNATPVGFWIGLPRALLTVLDTALEVGRQSGGAFEIAMGDAVAAWGFGPSPADPEAIRKALARTRRPSFETLDLDLAGDRARKSAEMTIDLSGIAKGYGVDRLIDTLRDHGVDHALAAIDGELRALGAQPDGRGWSVAVERPDRETRAAHSMFELRNIAIATSGDYRHWVQVGDRRLSHTMDPSTGGPLPNPPASVTVLAESCMFADAVASACMVLGETAGRALAQRLGCDTLFLGENDRQQVDV